MLMESSKGNVCEWLVLLLKLLLHLVKREVDL